MKAELRGRKPELKQVNSISGQSHTLNQLSIRVRRDCSTYSNDHPHHLLTHGHCLRSIRVSNTIYCVSPRIRRSVDVEQNSIVQYGSIFSHVYCFAGFFTQRKNEV